MIESRLTTIIQDLRKCKTINSLNISDDVLFQEACSFLRGELTNENQIAREKARLEKQDLPASERQVAFAIKLAEEVGVDLEQDVSKASSKEVSKLINDLKAKREGRRR